MYVWASTDTCRRRKTNSKSNMIHSCRYIYTQAWNETMWERLRLEELEQTCKSTQSWDEKGLIKMKSTGGLRKHIRHQAAAVCGNWLWKTEYHDFPGKTLTLSVTLTTVRQMKGKVGLGVVGTSTSVTRKSKLRKGYAITSRTWGKLRVKILKRRRCTRTDVAFFSASWGVIWNNLRQNVYGSQCQFVLTEILEAKL